VQKTLEVRQLVDGNAIVNDRQYYFSSRDFAIKNTDVLNWKMSPT